MSRPRRGRCDRIVSAALRAAEESLTAQISSRLTAESIERLVALVAAEADQDDGTGPDGGGTEGGDAPPVLGKIKEAPGNVSLETIAQQYDQMIKYATAIRTRTASTEAILRRFTRNASHPTYAAMLEVGRAQKTIFVARYLRLRDLSGRSRRA
ncbi:hypothetical protein FHS42_005996 [Streptomyces zagrosensis]|uniref:Tn3 transposase DDE domain-containing protein n=1 Tax=Streptomyces zagrosensis TaxID=1042984 RepID=A0A7W9QEQ5_9ACTN|nr:hypothetical protein [Streptomyces zagrosensis]